MEERKEELHPLGNTGQICIYPVTEEEISAVLKYADDQGKKVLVEGGGTKRGFGGTAESADILLSMKRYTGVTEHEAGDMTLSVKAGTTFKEIQEFLSKYKQQVSLDPAWSDFATIGGIVAANESGPKRLGYGSSRDVVIGLRNVYPDGTIIRSGGKVVKNVAGYDMNKLFVGAMGTLGIISEVTVKLRPLPKYESLILLSFEEKHLDGLRKFSKELLDSSLEPVALELLNPSLSKKLIGESSYTLVIAFEDVENAVHYQEEAVKALLPSDIKMRVAAQKEAQKFWQLFYTISPNGAIGDTEKIAALKIGVINLTILDVIKESHYLQESFQLEVDAHGGVGHGLGQLILKGKSEDLTGAIYHIRDFVQKDGGYAVVKHLPLALRKKVNVWGDKPSYFFLLEGIKSKIDPNKTLNPKRFIGGL
ncbi:FAD-binding oxidoreductase [Jeotgalibacillus sp. S-D1]|uniref:FAD-binding oxidoreductase n=1 Tax=Jeotgalibacillus sp. S-D1 TaxID=2552189 RepID=UPI001059E517|nr:FAD-binding oxidoreductase [Jeotgalibacillus sp. S-D1]TDL33143.1 FAD-binding oxidoreductase [Jeotgalibacillus sp. S-D1]